MVYVANASVQSAICASKSVDWHFPKPRYCLLSRKNLCVASHKCNKEEKSLLGMHKCQSRHFAAQIAHISITCLQYNFLSLAKRFSDYETIGEIFRGTVDDAQEVAFAERIMEFFLEIVPELEEACGCDTDKLIDTLIHKPEKSAVFVKICKRLAA